MVHKINCEYGAFHYIVGDLPLCTGNEKTGGHRYCNAFCHREEKYVQATHEVFAKNFNMKVCDECLIDLKASLKKIDKIVEKKTGWIREIMKYDSHDLQVVIIHG